MKYDMTKTAPLVDIFKVDPAASVIPVEVSGLALPSVESAGLLNDPNYPKVEGRGTYAELSETPWRYRYVKGAGNAESLGSETESDRRKFRQFGHSSIEHFCFGSSPNRALNNVTGPRVRGALALPHAVGEVLNAAVFLEVLMKKEGITSIAAAEAKGLTIPEGAVFSPAISADISEGLSLVRATVGGVLPTETLGFRYGLASLRVPASDRLRSRTYSNTTKGEFWSRILRSPEKMEMVGRVLKHQIECGFVSLSTHLQNVYDAPHSLCPNADSNDLVPISEIMKEGKTCKVAKKQLLQAVVMRQLQYLPFNLTRYTDHPIVQNDAKGAIHTMLSTVAPGEFTHEERESFATNFTAKPFTVLSSIANRLIARGMVMTSPQVDWKRVRETHANLAYDVVSEQMIQLALRSACALFVGVRQAEVDGGLKPLR